MNAREREELMQDLLEYHYGCHEDPAAVAARLDDPAVAALYDEVRGMSRTLGEAAREPLPPLSLEAPSHSGARTFLRRAAAVAACALLAGVAVLSAHWGWRHVRTETFRDRAMRVVLSGPRGVPDAAAARFRVETWDLSGAPRAATVDWRILDGEDRELESGRKIIDGAVEIDVAARLVSARRVEVKAVSGETVEEASLVLEPGGGTPLVHLTTDKSVYRPGETVRARGVFLDRLTLEPLEHLYRMRLVDGRDGEIGKSVVATSVGVGASMWDLPVEAAGGRYAVELRSADDGFTLARHEFLVRRFERPQLEKRVVLDRESYLPGQRGVAELAVKRMGAGPAEGAAVTASLIVDGNAVWNGSAIADADGAAVFEFEVPASVERGDARFVARIADRGIVETEMEPFVVPTGKLEALLYPEGGDLVVGVPCRIYVEVTDSLERPVDATGSVVDDSGALVARFESEHDGRGRFVFTPEADRAYTLILDGSDGKPIALPAAKLDGVVLTTRHDVVAAKRPVELLVHVGSDGPWIVGAFCRGVLVGHDVLAGSGDHVVAIDLPDEVAGVLRLTAFDRTLTPVAERLIQRASARRIDVELRPRSATLRPGNRQEVEVITRDEHGEAVAATVGLTVIDGAVRALVGGRRIGLADAAALAADVENVDDFDELLGDDAVIPRRVDLLLGTRGWRRFAWANPEETVAAHGARGQRLLAREGRPQLPAIHDTMSFDLARLTELESTEIDARETAHGAYALAILAMLAGVVLFGGARVGGALTRGSTAGRVAGAVTCSVLAIMVSVSLFESHGGTVARVALGADATPLFAAAGEEPAGAAQEWALEADDTALITTGLTQWLNDEDQIVDALGGVRFGLGAEMEEADDAPIAGFDVDFNVFTSRLPELATLETVQGDFRFRNSMKYELELVAGLELQQLEEIAEDPAALWRYGFQRKVVRHYAHARSGSGESRDDFTETVYWNPALETDATGRASVSFDVSDAATTWDVVADAHGARRVGQGEARFTTALPLRMEVKIPVETSAGDALRLPVAVLTDGDGPSFVRLTVATSGALALAGERELVVDLDDDGCGRVVLPVDVVEAGPASLELAAAWGPWSDRVTRRLRVMPRGFPHREVRSGVARGVTDIMAPFPRTHHEGTASASLRLFPSPLATIAESLDEMLREPHGCFEQASSTNYPNALVLSFLEATDAAQPAVAARARRLLSTGYEKLVGYECADRGYEWFGHDPGHEALTAYGLLEFHDMKRVHDVDESMIERTRAWLLARRDGEGGFEVGRHGLDSFGGADPVVTSVYSTYALAATGTAPGRIAKELDRVATIALESDDAYVVAVGACALSAAGRERAATAARTRLATMQAADGGVTGARTSITCSGDRDRAIEATSFAILAWLDDEDDLPHALAGLKYILGRRSPHGGFGATQATIMALKALTSFAEKRHVAATEGEVLVRIDERVVARADIEAGAIHPIVIDGLEQHLEAGVNEVTIEIVGDNELPWIFDLSYRSDRPASAPESPLDLDVALSLEDVVEGEPVAVEITLHNRSAEARPMAVAVIGLPAGLEVEADVLDALKDAARIDHWELRGRDVILYWRGLPPSAARRVVLDASARVPGRTVGAASRAWLYYSPETRVWTDPVRIDVSP